jgi:hypothetical protein
MFSAYMSCFHPNIACAFEVSKNDLLGLSSHHDLSILLTLPDQCFSSSSNAGISTPPDKSRGKNISSEAIWNASAPVQPSEVRPSIQPRTTASTEDQDHNPVCFTLDVVSLIEARVKCIRIEATRVPGYMRQTAFACSSQILLISTYTSMHECIPTACSNYKGLPVLSTIVAMTCYAYRTHRVKLVHRHKVQLPMFRLSPA